MDPIYQRPEEICGGQRQRVALARALAQAPDILLADEPTGNLDSKTGREILELFEQLNREGQTIIIVTHDSLVADRCRRVVRISDSLIVSDPLNETKKVETTASMPERLTAWNDPRSRCH